MLEFEIDSVQDGRWVLARRTFVGTPPRSGEQDHAAVLTFAVVGMAGAIVFRTIMGNARGADASQLPRMLGWADAEQMLSLEMAPNGLEAHAYRPWPGDSPGVEPVPSPVLLGGSAYVRDLDPVGAIRSQPLLRLLVTGELEALWSELDDLYRDDFVPALAPAAYAAQQQREGMLEAYERAAAGGEPVEERREAGLVDDAPTSGR